MGVACETVVVGAIWGSGPLVTDSGLTYVGTPGHLHLDLPRFDSLSQPHHLTPTLTSPLPSFVCQGLVHVEVSIKTGKMSTPSAPRHS